MSNISFLLTILSYGTLTVRLKWKYFAMWGASEKEKEKLKTSAFQSRYGGLFTLSTQLIKPIYLVILPTDAESQFLKKLAPL